MRVVSLNCSNTEILCALGCADMLVGVDDHSDFPPAVVRNLPRVGPDLEPDMERIAALKPDLVLASLTVPGHEKVLENLQSTGLQFIAPEPTTLEDVYDDVERIGRAVGAGDRSRRVVSEMRESMIRDRAIDHAYKPSVLVQWWPKPVIAPGRLSWVNDMINATGALNPLGSEDVKSRPMENSEVRDFDPDIIVMSWCGVEPRKYRSDVIYNKPEWADMQAVRNRHVYTIPEAYLGRPSPRLTSGSQALYSLVRNFTDRIKDSDGCHHPGPHP